MTPRRVLDLALMTLLVVLVLTFLVATPIFAEGLYVAVRKNHLVLPAPAQFLVDADAAMGFGPFGSPFGSLPAFVLGVVGWRSSRARVRTALLIAALLVEVLVVAGYFSIMLWGAARAVPARA
jgi:hypothetical protein